MMSTPPVYDEVRLPCLRRGPTPPVYEEVRPLVYDEVRSPVYDEVRPPLSTTRSDRTVYDEVRLPVYDEVRPPCLRRGPTLLSTTSAHRCKRSSL